MDYLYKKIYKDILNEIMLGNLKPGDKIPTEMELIKKYSVSRITATKAVNELVISGYVTRKRKKGTFVNKNSFSANNEKNKIIAFITPVDEYLCFQLIIGTQDAATNEGYCIVHYNSGNNSEKEAELIDKAISLNVSGIILFPTYPFNNIDKFLEIQERGIPLVFIDNKPNIITAPLINSNNYEAIYFLTSKLLENGHKNIGFFIMSDINNLQTSVESRLAGYIKAQIDNKIHINTDLIYKAEYFDKSIITPEMGQLELNICSAIDYFFKLSSPPTAVICINDEIAAKFVHFSIIKKVKIPHDLSVASFDNSSFALKSEIPLTTMSQNFVEIGVEATNSIIDIIKNKKAASKIIKMKYIERASTKKTN